MADECDPSSEGGRKDRLRAWQVPPASTRYGEGPRHRLARRRDEWHRAPSRWRRVETTVSEGHLVQQIDRIYAEIAESRVDRSPAVRQRIASLFAELRRLQEDEAKEVKDALERSRRISTTEVERVIARVDEWLAEHRHEDSSTDNKPPTRTDPEET